MPWVSLAKKFRGLFEKPGLILRPCAYDALSAIIIEKVGFEVVGTTGYGIAASLLGVPDIGLVSFGEMLERVRTIVNAVSIPVDVDADTGYGNPLNVYWTVYNLAKVGAAGVRIEDQVWPKKCGHMKGKMIISKEEMVQKIKAAVKARNEIDPDIIIGARTDARAIAGLDEAIERGVAYAKAGADYVYVEAPQSLEEVELLVKKIPAPIAFNIIPGGKTPPFSVNELERIGVKYLSIPMVALYAAAKAMMEALKVLKETRDYIKASEYGVTWYEFNELVGLRKWRQLEFEVLPPEELLKMYGTTDVNKIIESEFKISKEFWEKLKKKA